MTSRQEPDLPHDDDSPFLRFVGLEIASPKAARGAFRCRSNPIISRRPDRCMAV